MKKEKQAKEIKQFSSNKLILPLFFIFCSLFLDMISFIYLGFYQAIPTMIFFNIGGAFVFAGIIYIMPGKKSALTFFYIFIVLQIIINIMNANLYNVFGDLFSLDYFFLGQEGAAAVRLEFIDFMSIFLNLSLFVLIIFATKALFKYNKTKINLNTISTRTFALIFVLLFEFCGISTFVGETSYVTTINSESVINNPNYLWDSFRFKVEAYKSFGYYGFYGKNLFDFFNFTKSINRDEKEELLKFIDEGKVEGKKTEFSDDNLIVILCESHDLFAYDPINTPNMYDLITKNEENSVYDAAVMTNFYGHNKTNVSEQIVLEGNYPKLNTLSSLLNTQSYHYGYTLPKLFKKAHEGEDVKTTYFHSYIRTFYNRDPNYLTDGIGFDEYISMENYAQQKNDKSLYFGDWISDADFFETFKEKFIPSGDTKFMTAYATISTHGPYNTADNSRLSENYKKYDENFSEYKAWVDENSEQLGYSIPTDSHFVNELRKYKVGLMDFDNMIGKLFERLKETNHLDDTTVVLYGDHNCFYDNLCYEMKGISKDDYSNIESNHIPLTIYSSHLQAGEYSQFCNTYDIFPTICEKFGFAYNKNLVQGYDIFSDEIKNSFFASHLGGMFNSKFFSQNISDVVEIEDNLTKQDLENFYFLAEQYYDKQEKYEKIYLNNLT